LDSLEDLLVVLGFEVGDGIADVLLKCLADVDALLEVVLMVIAGDTSDETSKVIGGLGVGQAEVSTGDISKGCGKRKGNLGNGGSLLSCAVEIGGIKVCLNSVSIGFDC
jgi:hypothetical protein